MNLIDRLAARLDDEFDYDPRVKDAVLAELADMCKTKKVSAAKLKDSIIISCIETHLAALEDDTREEDDVDAVLDGRTDWEFLPRESTYRYEHSSGLVGAVTIDENDAIQWLTYDIATNEPVSGDAADTIAEALDAVEAACDRHEDAPQVHIVPIDTPRTAEDEAVVVIDEAPAPKKARKATGPLATGPHADCDHPATKAGRARCRRERAKAAAKA